MESENTANEPLVAYLPEITSLNQLDLSKRYSYADYFCWKFKERVELIKGFICKMSPAPGPAHQSVSFKTAFQFGLFFKGKPYAVFTAPFDVRLPDTQKQTRDEQVFTVLQPDLCVICDLDKIDGRGCIGSPDLVVEILSPGNSRKEMGVKFRLYEENGVKEYWIMDPVTRVVLIYVLHNGRYEGRPPLTEDHEICSFLFPGLKFRVKEVFESIIPAAKGAVNEPAVVYGPEIFSLDQLDFSRQYSYADYFRWKFEERVELIKGYIYEMGPTPTPLHQRILGELLFRFGNSPQENSWQLFAAPLDVRLPDPENQTADELIYTVVQPDICIICNLEKIDSRGCIGAPDLVIEILSPESSGKDTGIKFELYQEKGVKEYWIVNPAEKMISVFILENEKYGNPAIYTENDVISPALLPGLKFGVHGVFEF